ncbi:MAG: Crp/Fnr family transcriptional regulator [Zoogloea sp.]|jgi:CRP-like cAMP-binding protein|uniref:Crp/Fnr family transcriptional regulator n=1 Tax=Zoogloea sp. TaxID=49181 RepID=UPI00260D85A9|nr:Crp/Fnr family transcriptional regulator [Zoogloea sp.]MDD3326175.1 Crp/Fnr family transcriptional regulator [Zoogloea sp.]
MSSEKIDIPGLLSRMPLFSALAPDDLAHMAATTRERRLQKGERLFQRGEQPRGFFLIVWGQVKLAFTSAQGNEKVVEILGPLQSFGEAVMFLDQPYPVLGEALADTLVLHIASQAVFGQIEQDPRFARKLLAGMSIRLHTMVRDVESYALRSSTQRVIGYLLQLADTAPCSPAQGKAEIELPTSKQVIASRLSLTPETLSRIFHELSDVGLISVRGKHIVIHDAARLAEHD